MTEEKKAIVRDLGFGGLMHIPPLRVDHQLLRELAKNFKLGENKLKTGYGSFHITPKKIGDALGINATGKNRVERPPKPWIANWTKEQMDSRKRKQRQEDSDSDSESESEPSDESEESSPRKKEKKKKKTKTTPKDETYEISSDELDELLGENIHKSAAEGDNQADLRSTEGRNVSSETLPAVNLGSDDTSSQRRTEQNSVNQPSQSMLTPDDSNMMVVREQTPSEALAM
ncbi:uncharacterized protein LOC130950094 [Arachis stenosperma]|uniref:uncharacterized protein LOC130950094 n=1 Tax=Arachis stenosperma TaxID=217475 RepID=UPI0025AC72A7|nr:uncharacterized protein LOC130950094 [Arachis stenosperma]